MNYYPLDPSELHNKHVVKMPLEYAQMLSTAHHELDSDLADQLYRPTHKNHPSCVWARATRGNYVTMYNSMMDLFAEYTRIFGKVHKTEREKAALLRNPPASLTDDTVTEIPQCMPDEFKCPDVVQAYRAYLTDKYRQWEEV